MDTFHPICYIQLIISLLCLLPKTLNIQLLVAFFGWNCELCFRMLITGLCFKNKKHTMPVANPHYIYLTLNCTKLFSQLDSKDRLSEKGQISAKGWICPSLDSLAGMCYLESILASCLDR